MGFSCKISPKPIHWYMLLHLIYSWRTNNSKITRLYDWYEWYEGWKYRSAVVPMVYDYIYIDIRNIIMYKCIHSRPGVEYDNFKTSSLQLEEFWTSQEFYLLQDEWKWACLILCWIQVFDRTVNENGYGTKGSSFLLLNHIYIILYPYSQDYWYGAILKILEDHDLLLCGLVHGLRPWVSADSRGTWIDLACFILGFAVLGVYLPCRIAACSSWSGWSCFFKTVSNFRELNLPGWWFGTVFFPIQFGISSSQLTNSYFSEG